MNINGGGSVFEEVNAPGRLNPLEQKSCLTPTRFVITGLIAVFMAIGWAGEASEDLYSGQRREGGVADAVKVETSAKPELRAGNLRVSKVLFLGNSVTLHGPAVNIGWTGDWGMAASERDKDFVHLLIAKLTKTAGGPPQVLIKNIADFERQQMGYDLEAGLKDELAFEPDVVILAVGANTPNLATDEAKANYRTAFDNLLAKLKQHGDPVIFVRGEFWQEPVKEGVMRQACKDPRHIYVDLGNPSNDPANLARSERKIEHAGVGGHPGDRGMQLIADTLWKAIQGRAGISK